MSGRRTGAVDEEDGCPSNIYELVMSPCEQIHSPSPQLFTPIPHPVLKERRTSVFVNVFEEGDVEVSTPTSPSTPSTPRTPVAFSDVHGNTIHIQIPRGSQLYVNYEKKTC